MTLIDFCGIIKLQWRREHLKKDPPRREVNMAVSKAQQKAVTKYVKNKYDRFGLTMQKGRLDIIKAHAESQGESVNSFINRAIDNQMHQDNEKAGE